MAADLTIIAYELLSRDDIANLYATRDADELAELLIADAPLTTILPALDAHNPTIDFATIDQLHAIMTNMILNPID